MKLPGGQAHDGLSDPADGSGGTEFGAWLDNVYVVSGASRLAPDIASELQVEHGSIINSILCRVENDAVQVLMASDMPCDASQVAKIFNRPGQPVTRLHGREIEALTGVGADRQFPILLTRDLPTVMDASLQRFSKLYTFAGSPRCMIETHYAELKALTGATVSYALAPPDWRLGGR